MAPPDLDRTDADHAATPTSSAPLLDEKTWQHLWASLSSDGRHSPESAAPPMLREVALRYAPTAAKRLQQLRKRLQDGDLTEAADLAHAVKGNGAMIGAARVVELAANLEENLPRLPVVTAQVWAQVQQLENACQQTASELTARVDHHNPVKLG